VAEARRDRLAKAWNGNSHDTLSSTTPWQIARQPGANRPGATQHLAKVEVAG
jgi:hypothetical protein